MVLSASFQSVHSKHNQKTNVRCFGFTNLPYPSALSPRGPCAGQKVSHKQVNSGQSLWVGSLVTGMIPTQVIPSRNS